MRKHIINAAIAQAERSNFHHRHGCVIFKGDRIISSGFNEVRYCKKLDVRYRKWINSLHAEQKTILFSNADLRRCSLLVVRINNNRQLTYSKPCPLCQNLISEIGITKVYFSGRNGEIRRLLFN